MKSAAPETKTVTVKTQLVGKNQTGPKTAEGKARSSMNAMKHGRFANLPPGIESPDEAAAFKAAIGKLKREHLPVGELENFCCLQIAMGIVRQMRLWQLEAQIFDAMAAGEKPPMTVDAMSKQLALLSKDLDAAIKRLRGLQVPRQNEERARAMRARRSLQV